MADPMVWEVDESPTSVSEASVTPKCVCDWSVEAVVVLPALPPHPALPIERPLSALPTVSTAQSSPESDSPLKRRRPPSMMVPGGLPRLAEVEMQA